MFDIRQFVPQKVCLKCRGCCRFTEKESIWQPSLLEDETGIISRCSPAAGAAIEGKKIQPLPLDGCYVCPFLNTGDNRCRIYNLRPLECRLYPFLLNRTKQGIYLSADLNCPFMEDKPGQKEFNDYLNYLISFLSLPDVVSAVKRNPQILADYSQSSGKLDNLAALDF